MVTLRPKVSVVCVTYNQEKYIAQTLDSFVAQRTNFKYEVVVADDCSTDSTARIISKYAERYPDVIRPVLRKKNIGIQKNFAETFREAKGDYLAVCEGDDYWTDALKLQRQADFLDEHTTYSICFHPVKVFFDNNERREQIYPQDIKDKKVSIESLLRENFIQTNSVMYRRQSYDHIPDNILPIDWYLHLYHARFGKIGYIDKVMAAYRRHEGGVWWGSHRKNRDEFWRKNGKAHFALFAEILKLHGDSEKNRSIILESIYWMFRVLTCIDRKYKTSIVSEMIAQYPELASPYIVKLQDMQKEWDKVLNSHKEHIAYLEKSVELKDQEIAILSRSFKDKLSEKLTQVLKKRP